MRISILPTAPRRIQGTKTPVRINHRFSGVSSSLYCSPSLPFSLFTFADNIAHAVEKSIETGYLDNLKPIALLPQFFLNYPSWFPEKGHQDRNQGDQG